MNIGNGFRSMDHVSLITQTCIAFSATLSIFILYINDEPFSTLKEFRLRTANGIVCAQLNINSIRNKYDQLKSMIMRNMDTLILTETKLNNTFPQAEFFIDGYSKPYRFDRPGNVNGGGVMI